MRLHGYTPLPLPSQRLLLVKVFELQPDIAWDKGKAVLWLLDKLVMPMAQAPEEPAPPPPPPGEGGGAVTPPPPPVGTAAAAAASSSNGGSGGAGATKEEEEGDYDDEYSGRFFTIFIGDDKTDEVRNSIAHVFPWAQRWSGKLGWAFVPLGVATAHVGTEMEWKSEGGHV